MIHMIQELFGQTLRRFVVGHIGKTGSAAHGASPQGFVFLSCHPANMRRESVIFQRGTLPRSNPPGSSRENAGVSAPLAALNRSARVRARAEFMSATKPSASDPNHSGEFQLRFRPPRGEPVAIGRVELTDSVRIPAGPRHPITSYPKALQLSKSHVI